MTLRSDEVSTACEEKRLANQVMLRGIPVEKERFLEALLAE